MKMNEHQVLVEIEDQLAVIDRANGVIHIIVGDNVKKFRGGHDVDVVSTPLVAVANSSEWSPGRGKPPWAGGPGHHRANRPASG